MLRGMIIENLTQREGEFREEIENVCAIRKYLNENIEKLRGLRESRYPQSRTKFGAYHKEFQKKATTEDIVFWLNDITTRRS